MTLFRASLSLILVGIGATTGCNDDTVNTDEVGDTETDSDESSTSSDDSTSTEESESTSDSETTDESTEESESTTDESETAEESETEESESTSDESETADESETGGPVCGDGMIDVGEECDDGNDIDDDECANDCSLPDEFLIELANPAVDAAIADNGYNGLQGSMTCSPINVPDEGTVVDVTAVFGITHTFMGDVTAKLISPNGTVVTVFSRPGLNEMGDNGTGCCGESANLLASSPLSFSDEFLANPESMGGPLGTDQVVCLDDMICEYMTNPGSATAATMVDFVGESVTGNWTFCASDSSSGDTGQLVSIAISISATD